MHLSTRTLNRLAELAQPLIIRSDDSDAEASATATSTASESTSTSDESDDSDGEGLSKRAKIIILVCVCVGFALGVALFIFLRRRYRHVRLENARIDAEKAAAEATEASTVNGDVMGVDLHGRSNRRGGAETSDSDPDDGIAVPPTRPYSSRRSRSRHDGHRREGSQHSDREYRRDRARQRESMARRSMHSDDDYDDRRMGQRARGESSRPDGRSRSPVDPRKGYSGRNRSHSISASRERSVSYGPRRHGDQRRQSGETDEYYRH